MNYTNLYRSLDCVASLLHQRMQLFLSKTEVPVFEYPELRLEEKDSALFDLCTQYNLQREEIATLLIALAPHVAVNFFDNIIQQYFTQGGDFAEIGGVKGTNHRGMLPTGETVQFILAGNDLQQRLYIQQLLTENGFLQKEKIVTVENVKEGEPLMSGRLLIANEWLQKIFFGAVASPKFGADFPAKKISTQMNWSDLVLNNSTQTQVNDLLVWLQHNETLLKDDVLGKKIKPGYRVLFHGPPGTGKTLTATLLGKQFEKDVYRIDLSQVVSKYIGETEKNLEKVFSKAEHKNWILFFDEADALFGKRTNVQNSNDRYANQEVSYLLQRIEDFPGLLILASNFKNNLDAAFVRRFHSIIHFPAPNANERLTLWQKTIPASIKPESSVNLAALADKYELTGAAILNIVHYASLKTLAENDTLLRNKNVLEGIRKEFRKEEKTMN